MDRIMSTSIFLLGQNFNASDVDIMGFEPSVLFPPPAAVWGEEIDDMVRCRHDSIHYIDCQLKVAH